MIDDAEWRALLRWMDERTIGSGPIDDVRPLTGGTQNTMLRFGRGNEAFVLRRGPRHLRRTSNDAIRRESRVLGALAHTDVPHARLVAACPDETVLGGAAFFLMEEVVGRNGADPGTSTDVAPDAWRDTTFDVVDGLALLARVDHASIGLGDLGRPDGFLDRQVPRWRKELASYAQLDGYSGAELAGVDDTADWLVRTQPASFTPGIMHGDFHLANVILDSTAPRVAAIIDWEMCTIGEPLLDLGWLLATWPSPGNGAAVGPTDLAGLPTRSALVDRYAHSAGRDVSRIDWYEVLARFKLGILLEGTHARACAGLADPAVGDALHDRATHLLRGAQEIIHSPG